MLFPATSLLPSLNTCERIRAQVESHAWTDLLKGRVTVSFSLTDPVRTSRSLNIPAYRCEGGGDVTVAVTVDRAGKVTGARVTEGGDDCMRESALRAARNSLFNIDNSAPARQTGTITYIFIPQ